MPGSSYNRALNKRNLVKQKLLATAIMTGVASQGMAQGPMLEEVIVTAQKREQSLQDVPISVVAMDADALEARGIDELTDIGASIPSLVVNPFNGDAGAVRLFIRGIGQNDVQLTQDPSVALYMDGVYIGTSFGTGFEGVDIASIEVLRGPQGTLYGRNATGGAINIVTKRASVDGLSLRQDFQTGKLDLFKSRTVLNVPISDTLAAKASVLVSRRGGIVENNGPGADFGEVHRDSGVLDLRWLASDELTLDYRYEKANIQDSQRLEQITALNPGAPLAALTSFSDVSEHRLDSVTSRREVENNDLDVTAHALQAAWDVGDAITLKSITAYRELENSSFSDPLSTAEGNGFLYTGAPSYSNWQTDFEQFSQELQVIGGSGPLEYVGGLYYYQDEGEYASVLNLIIGAPRGEDYTATENTSMAIFGEATYTFQDRLHVTLGARFSRDNRKAERTNMNISNPIVDGQYDKDFSNFNPALTVSYDLSDNVNIYGKVVSGFKSGGTSQRSANATLFADGFEEEDILSYELGLKGDFWDQRARLNAAVYSMGMDGLQTSVQTGATPGERDFLPIDDNTVNGAEFDLQLLLSEKLTLSGGYSFLDTEMGAQSVTSAAGIFNLVPEYSYAPRNSYTLSLDYYTGLPNGALAANIYYGYQDEVNTSANVSDNVVLEDYGLLDASVSWENIRVARLDGSFKVSLWGKNLTDEEYRLIGVAAWAPFGAAEVSTFGDPRTYGVTLSYVY